MSATAKRVLSGLILVGVLATGAVTIAVAARRSPKSVAATGQTESSVSSSQIDIDPNWRNEDGLISSPKEAEGDALFAAVHEFDASPSDVSSVKVYQLTAGDVASISAGDSRLAVLSSWIKQVPPDATMYATVVAATSPVFVPSLQRSGHERQGAASDTLVVLAQQSSDLIVRAPVDRSRAGDLLAKLSPYGPVESAGA